MIKYSKFTDSIASGNFSDTFYKNTDKFQKIGRSITSTPPPPPPPPPPPLLDTPLHADIIGI